MKHPLLILICFLILSCNKKEVKIEKTQIDSVKIIDTTVTLNKETYPLYDFDQIEYYKSKLTREQESSLSETDSIGFKVLLARFPQELDNPTFFEKLRQNYSSRKVDSKFNDSISEIYSEKYSGQVLIPACDTFYRDILVFKKNNKIIGVSKICFECGMNWTIGNKRNAELLGENGDYDKLEKVLSKVNANR